MGKRQLIFILAVAALLLSQLLLYITLTSNTRQTEEPLSRPFLPAPVPGTTPAFKPHSFSSTSDTPAPTPYTRAPTYAPTPHPTPSPVDPQRRTFTWESTTGTSVECYQFTSDAQFEPFPGHGMSHAGVCVLSRACFWDGQVFIILDGHESELGQNIGQEMHQDTVFHWPPTLNDLTSGRMRAFLPRTTPKELFNNSQWFEGHSWIVYNSYKLHTSHWFETISQMYLARRHLGATATVPLSSNVVLPTHDAPLLEWQQQTLLSALDQGGLEPTISQGNAVTASRDRPWCFEKVSLPGFLYHMFPYATDADAYRRRVCEHLYLPPDPGRNVLLVVRRSTASSSIRVVRNQDELSTYLASLAEKFDLEAQIVDFSTMSFRDQVEVCSRAWVMVGMHGAGLQNSMFMQPGSALVELNAYRWFENRFFDLSHVCGLRYFSWTGTRVDDTDYSAEDKAMLRKHEGMHWPVAGYGGSHAQAAKELDTIPRRVYNFRRDASVVVLLHEVGGVVESAFEQLQLTRSPAF